MIQPIAQPTTENTNCEILSLNLVLKAIEKKVNENRAKYDDNNKLIKDFRRIFDQDSSRMNQAIFNDASHEETYQETLRTVSSLIEILTRTGINS